MCPLNHRPPGALPPFSAFALTARGGFAALPGVSLPTVACPGLQANPPSSGLGWPSAILRSAELYRTAINQIPSRWESNSQPLGIVFPAAGNRCPKGCGNFIRGDWGGFPPPQKHVARPSSPAAKGRNLSQFHKNLSQFHKIYTVEALDDKKPEKNA